MLLVTKACLAVLTPCESYSLGGFSGIVLESLRQQPEDIQARKELVRNVSQVYGSAWAYAGRDSAGYRINPFSKGPEPGYKALMVTDPSYPRNLSVPEVKPTGTTVAIPFAGSKDHFTIALNDFPSDRAPYQKPGFHYHPSRAQWKFGMDGSMQACRIDPRGSWLRSKGDLKGQCSIELDKYLKGSIGANRFAADERALATWLRFHALQRKAGLIRNGKERNIMYHDKLVGANSALRIIPEASR